MKKRALKQIQDQVEKHGARLLSKSCPGSKVPLDFRCACGLEFSKTLQSATRSNFSCNECSYRAIGERKLKFSMQYIGSLASKQGAKLVAGQTYLGAKKKYKFKCACGSTFDRSLVHSKAWGFQCSECGHIRGGAAKKPPIEKYQKIAVERGGTCLSKEYSQKTEPLTFRCAEGHSFPLLPYSFEKGSWCPICRSYKSEELTREIFQGLFKQPFKKVRPKWLIGSSGRPLELDGFNEKLAIAFEYNGDHHYELNSMMTPSLAALKRKHQTHKIKGKICRAKKIVLIVINGLTDPHEIYKDIIRQLKSHRIKDFHQFDPARLNLVFNKEGFAKVRQLAREANGEVLSKTFLSRSKAIDCRSSCGLTFQKSVIELEKSGFRCQHCGHSKKGKRTDIESLRLLAINAGSALISKSFKTRQPSRERLEWKCLQCRKSFCQPFGYAIKNAFKCQTCGFEKAGRRRGTSIEEVKRFAELQGSTLFSTDFIGFDSPLKFKCRVCGKTGSRTWRAAKKHGFQCATCGRAKLHIPQKAKRHA